MGCNQTRSTSQPAEPVAQVETEQERADEAPHPHTQEENSDGHAENQAAAQPLTQTEVDLPHIHGMGFSADGRQLFVAAHDGLRVFSEGQWLIPNLPAHDYMGYAATADGFYSSGHPHPSSGLVNPLGLVKSEDGGQTLTTLGFEGESDFHLMAAGYHNQAVYVLNPAPNSKLSVGLHYSLDEGQTWQQSALQGLTANPIQIVVHPTEANRVALATEGGLFLSDDYGNTFEQVGEGEVVTAVSFTPEGSHLLFGTQALFDYDLAEDQETSIESPPLSADDAIAYIAVNPAQTNEIALATFARHIYLTLNRGQSWIQIAQEGKAVSD